MPNNEVPTDYDAERYAGLIFAHRESILESWCDLVRVEDAEPATEFIRSQLDVSILALANWVLGVDPFESTMGRQWAGIKPSSEMTVGAVVSMSLLPEAVRRSIESSSEADQAIILQKTSEFTGMMTHRLLSLVDVPFDEDRWDQIAEEVEARYENQRIQRIRRLGVLIEIAHAVSTDQDRDILFERVQQAVIQLSGSDYTEISLIDPSTEKLRCSLVYGDGKRQRHLEQTLIHDGLANEVLRTGEALVVSDYETACQERNIRPSSALTPAPQRAWMGAPMHRGDGVAGVIAVSGRLSSYEPEDVELLAAIAKQTAVALDNQRLIEAQQRHVAQLSAVNHIARETAHLRDAAELLDVAADRIQTFFDYGLVTVFRTSIHGDSLTMQARTPIPVEEEVDARLISISRESVVGDVASRRTPVLHDDIRDLDCSIISNSTRTMRSEMAAPIIHSGRLLGVIDVQSEQVNAFDKHDLTTLQTIADQLSVGLENSRLFAEEAQRTRELRLMLETTRAASSSLLLDEVLDRLAAGLASAAGTHDCLIHLYEPDDGCFSPAAYFKSDTSSSAGLFDEWDRILPVDDYAELSRVLDDPFPQLLCSFSPTATENSVRRAIYLVPLRTRLRTLGLAVVASTINRDSCYPLEQMRLLQGVADSGALAVENARLYAQAHGLAIAEERGRLAQEIHDTLAQGLTAISLQLDLADSYLPEKPANAAVNVQRALDLTRENLNQARRSVLDLRAADVHQMSLPDAISQLLRRLGDDSDITFEFTNDRLMHRLSARVEVGLYRILEEALENARRHSDANSVRVEIEADGKTVAVLVEDDGRGFDPGQLSRRDGADQGFGLLGIRERARLLGGSLTISSTPDVGTSIRVVVPYEARLQPSSADSRYRGEQK